MSRAVGPHLVKNEGFTYHGCRPCRSKFNNPVIGLTSPLTAFTARKDGLKRHRYRMKNLRAWLTIDRITYNIRFGRSMLPFLSLITLPYELLMDDLHEASTHSFV